MKPKTSKNDKADFHLKVEAAKKYGHFWFHHFWKSINFARAVLAHMSVCCNGTYNCCVICSATLKFKSLLMQVLCQTHI